MAEADVATTSEVPSPAQELEDAEVIIVGAGMAGLMCATVLEAAGVEVQVVEAAPEVGGRITTDEVDGFLLDRGFQVLNPAYPAVQEHIDVTALGMQTLGAGVEVLREVGERVVLADPLREPRHLRDTLTSGYLDPRELLALARWAGPSLGPVTALTRAEDRSRARAMDAVGLTGPLRRVVDGFLSGTVLEDDGSTSNGFIQLLLRMFALGSPGLPRRGMQALPQQLADRLRRPVRTGARVEKVSELGSGAGVHVAGSTARAALVVVATAGPAAEELIGVRAPVSKGVVTDWFTMPEAPSDLPMLLVDGRPHPGPIKNTAVISAGAPSYAPAGRPLVQTSVLLPAGTSALPLAEVRRHAAELYGVSTQHWQHVHRHEVAHALPAQPPPLVTRQPLQVSEHIIVCGDHRDTASIQGAMVSGKRAAAGYLRRTPRRP
jgi:glycine/D-amino acid oxidase-like deaminating enzyme